MVALVRCRSYVEAHDAISRALAQIEFLERFRGRRVLLKVNLMKGAPPERALNTHPDFVRALLRIVRENGGQAAVGDSSGVLGFTDEVCRAAGLMDIIREEGAKWVNFDAGPFERVALPESRGEPAFEFWIPKMVREAELFITVPKLKTHTLTLLTCALKNQVGLLPGGSKCAIHEVGPSPDQVSRLIVRINAAVPPSLAVVDAVVGLSGQGKGVPAIPRDVGAVVAGEDIVAVDAVCARLIGFGPMEVPTTRAGVEMGLGTADLASIEIRGERIENSIVPFDRPGFELKRSHLVARRFYRLRGRSVRPYADRSRCARCGTCVKLCPTHAIELAPFPRIGAECIRCYACHLRCPESAMRLVSPWYLKPFFRRKAAGLDVSKLG